MRERWGVQFELIPPDIHRRNAAVRAIQTFKDHFLAILSSVAHNFPRHLWDLILPQTEMALNLLRQATANTAISAWKIFNGKFNYNAMSLGFLE